MSPFCRVLNAVNATLEHALIQSQRGFHSALGASVFTSLLVHVFILHNKEKTSVAHALCQFVHADCQANHSRILANLFWCPWSKCHVFLLISFMDVYHRVSWCFFVGSSTCGTLNGTSCDSTCESFRCEFLSLDARLNIHVARNVGLTLKITVALFCLRPCYRRCRNLSHPPRKCVRWILDPWP